MNDRRPWIRPVLINGYEAVVEFEPVTGIYHGEFTGLTDQIDFYATDEAQVPAKGGRTLAMFLHQGECRGMAPEDGE